MPSVSRQEAIHLIRSVFSVEGADGVVRAFDAVGASQDTTTRKSLSLERAFGNIERKYISSVRAQQDYAKIQEQVNAAVAQNPALQERANVVLTAAAEKLKQVTAANENYQRSLAQTINERFGVRDDFGYDKRAQDIAAYGNELDNVRAKYNPLFAAERQYKTNIDDINKALKVGAINEKEHATALRDAEQAYKRQTTSLGNYTTVSKQARYELINLSRQVQDVVVGLYSGQKLGTVAVQQGFQIGDVFASSSEGARGLLTTIKALITPAALLTGGIVGLGVALAAGVVLWKNYALQLDDLSSATNIAVKDLSALQSAAAVKGISSSDFASGIKAFTNSVYEAKAGTNDLARLFYINGKNIATANDALYIFADLIKNAKNDQERLVLLQTAGITPTADAVRFWKQGADGIEKAKEEAIQFGGVVNDAMVLKAREFSEAWNKSWEMFSNGARNGVVGAASLIQQLVDSAANFLIRMSDFVGSGPIGMPADQVAFRFPRLSEQMRTEDRTVTSNPTKTLTDQAAVQHSLQMEAQRIQLLGELATTNEKVRLTEIQIAQARQQPGNQITDEDAKRILDYARAQEDLARAQEKVSLLGSAATEYEKYAVAVQNLNIKLMAGRINQQEFTRAVIFAEPVFNKLASSLETNLTSGLVNVINGTKSAKEGFTEMAKSILMDLEQILIKLLIVQPLIQALGGGVASSGGLISSVGKVLGFANGGVMTSSGPLPLQRYAQGGVADTPQIAVFGERMPEAYVPLPDGRSIPVKLAGNDNRQSEQPSRQDINIAVNVSGARGNREISEMVHQGIASGLAAYDRALPGRIADRNRRFG